MSYLLPHLQTGGPGPTHRPAILRPLAVANCSMLLLSAGFAVDQAILSVSCCLGAPLHLRIFSSNEPQLPVQEEDRVVIIRFGHDWDQTCMQMDEVGRPLHAEVHSADI